MDNSLIMTIISLIFVFVALLFSVFLLTVKTNKKLSNILLASFLLVIAIDISVFFYYDFVTLPPVLEMLRIRIAIFKSPLLFLYIISVIYSDFKLRRVHLFHLLPFFIGVLLLTPNFYSCNVKEQLEFFQRYQTTFEIQFIRNFGSALSLFYLAANIYYIRRYRKLILENYTDPKSLLNYRWLVQLIVVIISVSFLTYIKDFFKYASDPVVLSQMRIVMLIGGLIFICWMLLKALYAPKIFSGVSTEIRLVKEESVNDSKNNEEQKTEDRKMLIKSYMEQYEPYTDSGLTIQQLADKIEIPARELSVLINHQLNKHFFDFINEYRIEKAKKLLVNPSSEKMTIQEIMYDVGFNSKNPFNTAFKKYTNMTPTQYLKSVEN